VREYYHQLSRAQHQMTKLDNILIKLTAFLMNLAEKKDQDLKLKLEG
jgi:hypothetical protein